jgi:membrane peptidoglycan carboxypeptidase
VDETVFGKTGSNGDRDAYFIGYRGGVDDENDDQITRTGFHNIVFGVWIGNDHNENMKKQSVGGRMPARMAASLMRGVVSLKDTGLDDPKIAPPPQPRKNQAVVKNAPIQPESEQQKNSEESKSLDELLD